MRLQSKHNVQLQRIASYKHVLLKTIHILVSWVSTTIPIFGLLGGTFHVSQILMDSSVSKQLRP